MKALEKRLRELEASESTGAEWGPILDALGDGELMRLERIVRRLLAGEGVTEEEVDFVNAITQQRKEWA